MCKVKSILFLIMVSNLILAQTVCIDIENIRDVKGQLCVAVFDSEEGFKSEKPIREYKFEKLKIENGKFQFKIQLFPGRFGISVLNDTNSNGKMEYLLFGIPKEGFGFSDYFHQGFKKPHFEDFDFFIKKNEQIYLTVKLKYLN